RAARSRRRNLSTLSARRPWHAALILTFSRRAMEIAVALAPGNPFYGNEYIGALAYTRWQSTPQNTASDGRIILTYFLDQDPPAEPSTAGAWTFADEIAFSNALHAWEAVAAITFLGVDNAAAADITVRKLTDADMTALHGATVGNFDFPDSSTHVGDLN